jgi:Mrp family chromosome partitioning ATPase
MFRLANQYGLSALLSGRVNGIAIERVRHFSALSVLPAGGIPPNPLELVSRAEFKDLLAFEESNFDVILIDTPAAARSSDAQAVAARAGGALLVVRENRSRVEGINRLSSAIKSTNAEVVGCVVNRF